MRKIFLLILFLTFTPVTLLSSIISLVSITTEKKTQEKEAILRQSLPKYETRVYAPLEINDFPTVFSEVIVDDARIEIVRNYLQKNKSPLLPHADVLVNTADKYGLDYRLLPAIAQKESGLCRVIPPESHNCWGWGIHSKGTLMFDNYPEAIETVAKGLKEKYIDLGYVTPDQIMKKYAHPDSTTWADGVKMYMAQLD